MATKRAAAKIYQGKRRGPPKASSARRTVKAKAPATGVPAKPSARSRKPVVIDFHCHMRVPEVVAFCKGHGPDASVPDHPNYTAAAKKLDAEWAQMHRMRTGDMTTRLALMDEQGVDIQVLSPSGISQYTLWADPETSLKWERRLNDGMAEMVASVPGRFVGLGSLPLHAPELAIKEMQRCIGELGLRGIQIGAHAEVMDLGDARMKPFWAAAQRLDVALFLHPAGLTDSRYKPYHLWNSLGQPLEEAMAMASLWYEGVLDEFPRLKICVAHGGGFLPYYAGRVDRNYEDKPFTRVNMKKKPSDYIRENFYYDTSVYNPDLLEVLIERVGHSRVIMGSDYPSGEDDPVGFVRQMKRLSAADKAAILGGNAAKFLGLTI
ncbi:MAG: amidohydrolase family protein [Burkholderiales bacterium]